MPLIRTPRIAPHHLSQTEQQRFCTFFYDLIHKPAEDAADVHIMECFVNGIPSMAIVTAETDPETFTGVRFTPVFVGVNMGMAVSLPIAEQERLASLHHALHQEN